MLQSAAAKGINCDGSALCGDQKGFLNKVSDFITDNINGTSNGASGQEVRDAILRLKNHGCKGCGLAPFIDNDVDKGELTVNYVTSTCGDGVCNGALNPKR
ncbi:Kp4 domain-containing protein [Fusarium sp. Ph1]|nr:Kp4 domain-containing protein [Fusarium sp. Ph1]